MRLESITLHGFKSFGQRTEIKVLPGITAIVGPNGCGKCLVGDTPVALADGHVVPIGALVEAALARGLAIRQLDDGVAAVDADCGLEVLSLDPFTLRLERRPIEAFIKRAAPTFLLRVRTRSGREVVSTHYHPFFSLEGGLLKALTAEELVEGIVVAVPRCLPVKPGLDTNLADEVCEAFRASDRVYVPHSVELQAWLGEAARRVGGWSRLAKQAGVPANALYSVEQQQGVNVVAVARVGEVIGSPLPLVALKSAGRGVIRVPEAVDGRLARFLGYLIAEGRTTASNQVWFVNSDVAVSGEFARLAADLFGVVPRRRRYRPDVTDTLIFSRALCRLLDRVFRVKQASGSAGKVVPPQIFAARDEVIAEFLSGLFEGDAFIHEPTTSTGKTMPYLEYGTASRQLADGVATLLLRLGVGSLIRPKRKYASNTATKQRRTYYSVYVYGVDQLQQLAAHLRFVGSKQSRLDAVRSLEVTGNPNLDVVPGVTPLIRSAVKVGSLSIKSLRHLSPKLAAYAEGRCAASRAGLVEVAGLVERHGRNADAAGPLLRRLRVLSESDVYWDEVVSVEKIPPPEPWVYDLTVADTHNFVAGNFIVHNSNIAEGLRWALGEQSPKSLRSQRMEDVIFHGSASHQPVGMAEVELVFGNDGALAVPWSEIAVGRRLYRTGESEYLLNHAPTRLRDILDLFAGTGANPRAYSVMDQEKLNHVLTAKPHERRVFIEEAAGIARYKQQRNETQGKLDAARQNLLRVKDVMDEVRRQLGSLERQARKAQQYKALAEERRTLRLALVAADYAALVSEGARLEAELGTRRERQDELQVSLSRLAARVAAQRETIQASEHRLGDRRQSLQKVQAELERLLERREQMGVQLREAGDEEVRLDEEVRITAERLDGIAGERGATRTALGEAERLVVERQTTADELAVLVERQRGGLAAERDRLESLRLEQVRLAAERTDLTRSAGEMRERRTQLIRRVERLTAELDEAQREGARLAVHRGNLEQTLERARLDLTTLIGDRERLAVELAESERALSEAEVRLGEARVALAAGTSSLDALRELERAREGYGSGVRALFNDGGDPRMAGVLGTVADLIEVPPDLERVVEAALGERLEWVVVERFDQARAAVAYLKSQGGGAATFLPLEHLGGNHHHARPGDPPAAPPQDANGDGLRWLADQVATAEPSLLQYLLGRVAVVDHLDQAEALWQRNGKVAIYVTPYGEVLGPTGRLRGGAGAGAGERSLLARKRQVRELEDEIQHRGEEVEAAQDAVVRLTARATALRGEIAGRERTLVARQTDRLAGEKDLEQALRDQERVLRHTETVRLEAAQVTREAEETESLLDRLEQRIAAAAEAEAVQEATIAGVHETIEAAQQRETALVATLTASRVEVASVAERVEALGRELGRIDQMESELTERLTQTRARQQQLAARRVWLDQERERTDGAAREVAQERDRGEVEVREAAERHETLLGELRVLEQETRGLESELGRLIGAIHDIELRATERRVRREELAQDALRSWGVDEPALRAAHDPSREPDALRQRVGELEERLAAIGPVNLVADEEYRELDERLTFLRTQHDDLMASIKDLDKALRGMTRTAQERFTQAFHEINREFSRLFERLFEGGRAELRLVEAEEGGDPLDTGVELMAQPRGKRLQSVTLLSGGERALTGLALLFAIFYYRPSPFCVLDEVDAPLDDANIHRFLRVLVELTDRTQFLVITHNRRTMEAADILYGVTMEEPGLSRLVSVKLHT